LQATSTKFGFTVEALLVSRVTDLVKARHIAMCVCRHQMGLSYPTIAFALNRRDHTTAMHAVGKIDELVVRDRHAVSQVIELTARLQVENGMSL
jgi:chromosomal replication initiator protein